MIRKYKRCLCFIMAVVMSMSMFSGMATIEDTHDLIYYTDDIMSWLDNAVNEGQVADISQMHILNSNEDILNEISEQITDKYLVSTQEFEDGCIAYLTMNPYTYEVMLITSNLSDKKHIFNLILEERVEDVQTVEYQDTQEEVVEIPEQPLEQPEETPDIGDDGAQEGDTGEIPQEKPDTLPEIPPGEKPITPPEGNTEENPVIPPEGNTDGQPITPPENTTEEKPITPSEGNTDEKPVTPEQQPDAITEQKQETVTETGSTEESTMYMSTRKVLSNNTQDGVIREDTSENTQTTEQPSSENSIEDSDDEQGEQSLDNTQIVDEKEEPTEQYTNEIVSKPQTTQITSFVLFASILDRDPISGLDTFNVTMFDYDGRDVNDEIGSNGIYFIGGDTGKGNGTGMNANQTDKPYQGIAQNTLDRNGNIQFNNNNSRVKKLFNTDGLDGKQRYANVAFPFFKDANGYYTYNSSQNHAYLNESTKEVALYRYTVERKGTGAGFWPFINVSSRKQPDSGTTNFTYTDTEVKNFGAYHFGMIFETDFIMPKNGVINGNPMMFEFSGDDDVWVFIDGKLALDIGGIHPEMKGKIDFSTGDIKYYKGDGSYISSISNKNLYTNIGISSANYQSHTLKMFYLERGAGGSNCNMQFNIPTIPKNAISVAKEVDGINDAINDQTEFTFKAYKSATQSGSYTVMNNTAYKVYNQNLVQIRSGTTDEDGQFLIKDGEIARFENMLETEYYYVEEIMNSNYPTVKWSTDFNNSSAIGTKTSRLNAGENSSVTFRNTCSSSNKTNLKIAKTVSNFDSEDEFGFKVYFGDKKYTGPITVYNPDGTVKKTETLSSDLMLRQNEYAVIADIPYNTNYKIIENSIKDYNTPNWTVNGTNVNNTYEAMGIVEKLQSEQQNTVQCINSLALETVGSLTINKTIDRRWKPHGDPIFMFKLEKLDNNGNVESTIFDFIRFNGRGNEDNTTSTGSLVFYDLPYGRYRVSEEQPIRYEFGDVSTQGGTIKGESVEFMIGKNTEKNFSVTYHNNKMTDKWFTHTDLVQNSFTIKTN